MNNKLFNIICFIFISTLYSQSKIEDILTGKYNTNVTYNNINEEHKSFLNGLLEVDGEKSKEYFLEYYNSEDTIYREDSIMKIAEYFYSRGSYLQSSNWYKKITSNYPESKYIDTAVNYYINSLVIVGKKDSAVFYSQLFNDKYKHLNFNDAYLKPKKEKFNITKNKNLDTIYSVQVGSYRDLQKAKKRKRILSREGFLCRIDEVIRGFDIFYAVRIGSFKNKSLASKEQKRLKYRIGIYDSIIIKIN